MCVANLESGLPGVLEVDYGAFGILKQDAQRIRDYVRVATMDGYRIILKARNIRTIPSCFYIYKKISKDLFSAQK